MGSWGANKVGVIWNWGHNAPTPELEKIYVAYKKKSGDDFIFAAHWNSMNMLLAAIREAKSSNTTRVAYALEGMKYKSPVGEVEMRKTDHPLQAPLFLGIWAKQGSKGVKLTPRTPATASALKRCGTPTSAPSPRRAR